VTHPQSSQSRLPSSKERAPVRFSVYELDSHAGELRKHGIKVRLQNKPLRILELLLEHPGEVVTREQLRETLWPPDVYVDFDHSLNSAVNKLREALGDSAAQPRFIETLPRGYRFIASVSEPAIRVPPPAVQPPPSAEANVETPLAVSRRAFWRRTAAVAGVVLGALGLVALGGFLTLQVGALTSSSQLALAVLPFQNLSADAEQEFFSDGFTDELIAQVGRLAPEQLRVIARTSAMHYKRTNKTVDQIGRELGVDYILEGSVLRAGSRVRITGQLVRVRDQAHLWSQSYERDLRDVLAIQTQVARTIAEEIEVTFERTGGRPMHGRSSVHPDVYEAYLRGRYLLDKSTRPALAIEYFQQAIAMDSSYAPAYAGLADAYGQLGWGLSGQTPSDKAYPNALAAALKALELDDGLAAAHVALAKIRWKYEWNWTAAEQSLTRAIELDPNSAEAHESYFDLLSAMGRNTEAYARLRRAAALDPVSLTINYDFGLHFARTRDYAQAADRLQKAIELDPSSGFVHHMLGELYAERGMFDEAISELQRAIELSGPIPHFVAMIAHVKALSGDRAAPAKAVAELKALSEHKYVSPYDIALVYLSAGNREQALHFLERAYQQRDPWLSLIRAHPRFSTLNDDARFRDLMRRIGLAES
jgi:TolB-like protein/DNA-binding winged helix-turn-helix (wHTH) protein/tetratricopeptide (TPR) repeat protein